MNKKGMLGNMIAGPMIIFIGVMLLPTIIEKVGVACSEQMNISSFGSSLICSSSGEASGFIMLFFMLTTIVIAIVAISNALRGSGLLGYDDGGIDYEDEDELSLGDSEDEDEDEESEFKEDLEEDEIEEEKQEEDRVVHKKW